MTEKFQNLDHRVESELLDLQDDIRDLGRSLQENVDTMIEEVIQKVANKEEQTIRPDRKDILTVKGRVF